MPKKKRFFVQKKMRMRKSKALIIDYRIKKKIRVYSINLK